VTVSRQAFPAQRVERRSLPDVKMNYRDNSSHSVPHRSSPTSDIQFCSDAFEDLLGTLMAVRILWLPLRRFVSPLRFSVLLRFQDSRTPGQDRTAQQLQTNETQNKAKKSKAKKSKGRLTSSTLQQLRQQNRNRIKRIHALCRRTISYTFIWITFAMVP
jgi:hypothetical protein